MYEQTKNLQELIGDNLPFKHNEFNTKSNKPKILILGTRVTKKSIEAGYYYFGLTEKENCFWSVVSYCFSDNDFVSNDVNKVKNALSKHNIVVSDLIYNCKYTGSSDNGTVLETVEANMEDLVSLIEKSDFVILNGGFNKKNKKGTLNFFHKFLDSYIDKKTIQNKEHVLENGYLDVNNRKILYLSLDSTSGENRKDIYVKKTIWKKYIDKFLAGEDINN